MDRSGIAFAQRIALWALLLFALGVRIHAALVEKTGLSYDESISYLCSATTQARYATVFGNGHDTLVTAGTIQGIYATPALNFGKVAKDMSTLDRHPPLFFWGLHAVHHFYGFHLYDGLFLEIALGLFLLVLLYHIVRSVTGSSMLALLTITLYYLSPAVLQLDLEARNYQLLGVLALCSGWLGERISAGERRWWYYPVFIVVNAAGFLTHYYYGFLLVPGVVLFGYRNGLRRPLFVYIASLVASLLLFFALFPGFFDFLHVFADEAPPPYRTLFVKLRVMLYFGWAWAFSEGHYLRYGLVGLAAIAAGITLLRQDLRQRLRALLMGRDAHTYYFWILAWHVAFTSIFYVVDIPPDQAVGEQYYSYIWPLFAWFLVLWMRRLLPARVQPWVAAAMLAQFAFFLPRSVRASKYISDVLPPTWYARMNAADLLVTNARHRSDLPRTALHLRLDLPVQLSSSLRLPVAAEARELCYYVDLANGPKDHGVAELMARPDVPHEVFMHEDRVLYCFHLPRAEH